MDFFASLFGDLFHIIETAPELYALSAIFLWVLLEEAGVPLVPTADMVLIFAGWRVSQGQLNPIGVVAMTVAATVLGATFLYLVANRGGQGALRRYGRLIHLDPVRLARAERWVAQHRAPALVAGRMIPGLKTVVSVAAGLFDVELRSFALYTALAATVWAVSSVTVGRIFGPQLAQFVGGALHSPAALAALAAAATPLVIVYLKRRRAA
jgi:membrane protein DedA with SNARE-associated domain